MSSLDWRSIFRELRTQHWTLTQAANGHWKAVPPDPSSSIVVISESKEPRAIRNTIRDLQKSGFRWNEREPRSVREPHVDLEPVSSIREMSSPPEEKERPTLDASFSRLKEAKDNYDLASLHESELLGKMEALRLELSRASDEKASARRLLTEAKSEFDSHFDEVPQAAE